MSRSMLQDLADGDHIHFRNTSLQLPITLYPSPHGYVQRRQATGVVIAKILIAKEIASQLIYMTVAEILILRQSVEFQRQIPYSPGGQGKLNRPRRHRPADSNNKAHHIDRHRLEMRSRLCNQRLCDARYRQSRRPFWTNCRHAPRTGYEQVP